MGLYLNLSLELYLPEYRTRHKFLSSTGFIPKMHIKNTAKKEIIAKNANLCSNILSQSLGLMFALKPRTLIFIFKKEKIIPLHMFFVFYPIDVLFLNKNKIIVEIKENFMPFTFYIPKNKSKYVIELEKNTIKKTKTEIRDKIKF